VLGVAVRQTPAGGEALRTLEKNRRWSATIQYLGGADVFRPGENQSTQRAWLGAGLTNGDGV